MIGFGARRIFDDDRIEAKYLNTPETPIYKKSQVLYGIDLARRDIARASQAVVVEGYTDVMACHLAGVGTAVATCGTSFGDDHARVLRRLLHDHEEFRGEVIFTFDGDEAGQKAALRAFGGDQQFVGQTYVAVEPDGLDPCDLRLQKGDAAVRELVARRVPLYRFVLANVVSRYDLDRADGRIDALREAARLVCSVRDRSKVDAFARELAGMIGVEVEEARAEVRRARRPAVREPAQAQGRAAGRAPERAAAPGARGRPAPARPARPPLRAGARDPQAGGPAAGRDRPVRPRPRRERLHPPDVPRGLGDHRQAGGAEAGVNDPGWAHRLRDNAMDPAVSSGAERAGRRAAALHEGADTAYVHAHVFRLQELTALRRITDLKSQAAAHQPGRARHRVQPDVRRAGRAGAAPPHAARPGDGLRVRGLLPGRNALPDAVRRARWRRGRRCWPAPSPTTDGRGRHPRRRLRRSSRRVPWETVEKADWSQDDSTLTVVEVGYWGERAPGPHARLDEPGRFLQLVRERVTASVVLQRHVPVRGRRGRLRDRPPGAAAETSRSPGSTSSRRASTPTTPTYAGWPRRRSPGPATRSGSR